MNYREVIEEQITTLQGIQHKIDGSVNYIDFICKISETIIKLADIAARLPRQIKEPEHKQ